MWHLVSTLNFCLRITDSGHELGDVSQGAASENLNTLLRTSIVETGIS